MGQPLGISALASGLTAQQRAYYCIFVISLFICWSPFKAFAYFAPFVALLIFILLSNSGSSLRNATIAITSAAFIAYLHLLTNPQFVIQSAALWILTHGCFFVIFAIPSKGLNSPHLLRLMHKFASLFVIIQALWGIGQALYGSTQTGTFDSNNGDWVEGTIHPALHAEFAFSNVMYAANMALLLVALVPAVINEGKYKTHFALGIIALVLASVVHNLLFLFIAGVISYILIKPPIHSRRVRIALLAGFAAVPLLASIVLARNVRLIAQFYLEFIRGDSPRSMMIHRVLGDLPQQYPWMPAFGLGPGQFSSRAGMIGTGRYFGGPESINSTPLIDGQFSRPQEQYFFDLWYEAVTNPFYGSTQVPGFSWLSTYTELGAIALVMIAMCLLYLLVRLRRAAIENQEGVLPFATSIGILLIALLGLQENYWEVPQAIFVGILLLKVMYANSVYTSTPLLRKQI